jgi:hypothetical protein
MVGMAIQELWRLIGVSGLPLITGSVGQLSLKLGSVTDDLDLEDVVGCPHCGGVLSGPWEDQWTSSPS